MLKPWNRARSKLGPFQISIGYLSPVHVKICFQLIIGIPSDQFLSICNLKFYMFFLFPILSIPVNPTWFRYPNNKSRKWRPHIIQMALPYHTGGTPISYRRRPHIIHSAPPYRTLHCSLISYRNYLLNTSFCRVVFFMGENS
jgi:hypothetical protein